MGRPRTRATEADMSTWSVAQLKEEIKRIGLPTPTTWIKKSGLIRLIKETRKTTRPATRSETPRSAERQLERPTGGCDYTTDLAGETTPEERLMKMEASIQHLTANLGTLTEAMTLLVKQGSDVQTPPVASTSSASTASFSIGSDVMAMGSARNLASVRSQEIPQTSSRGIPGNAACATTSFRERDVPFEDNGGRGLQGLQRPQQHVRFEAAQTATSPKEALLGKGVASHNVPRVALVSPRLRNDILSGKDVNLARLLIPDTEEYNQREIVISGGEAIPVKPRTDQRLLKNLSLSEFIKAFSLYKDVMIEGYPHRADELAMYMNEIVDMATDFGGTTFYQYHKQFSARASALLLSHHIKIDWSIRDNDLYCKLFAGRRANSCALCSSMAHSTGFCPLSLYPARNQAVKRTWEGDFSGRAYSKAKKPKPEILSNGQEICNNFNTKGCSRGESCFFAHVCMLCKSEHHTKVECVRKQGSRPYVPHTQSSSSPNPDMHNMRPSSGNKPMKPGKQ